MRPSVYDFKHLLVRSEPQEQASFVNKKSC